MELQSAEAIYRELLLAGSAAVPEALDFLRSGEDLPLRAQAGDAFDFQSLRLAIIDALRQIGGAAVERLFLEQLQTTASPGEVEALANALNGLQPDLYRNAILDVTVARLAEYASLSVPAPPLDTAPLFRVLQELGDGDTAVLLQGMPHWLEAYATVAMADLPGGEGIPTLARFARRGVRNPQDNQALYLLAQSAVWQPLAEQALVELIRDDDIQEASWPLIADILMGDRQMQLQEPSADPLRVGSLRGSNPFALQTFVDRQVQQIYSVNYSAVLTTEEVEVRLRLIDRLLGATMDPAARASLSAARNLLDAYY